MSPKAKAEKVKVPPKKTGKKIKGAIARCMKCKENREFDGDEVIWSNGMRVASGKCPVCGTGMNRILGKAK